ncbi:glycosyltransferase family 25 protein, partial [Glonium stellatum]
FQKILVINLPSRTDRRDAMSLSAAVSDLQLDWINGVSGEDVMEKALPLGDHKSISPGNKGSWRAHMNALQAIVEQNLTTALILEDDVDWDIRIKSQLQTFALASRGLQTLFSNKGSHPHATPNNVELGEGDAAHRSSVPLPSVPLIASSTSSLYGSGWDVLWLGHCGTHFPSPSPSRPDRVTIPNDITVPEPQHLKPHPLATIDDLATLYPPHTRVVHRANTTTCSVAYALTQSGARKLLYEFGVREFSRGYDFMLSDWCDGLIPGFQDLQDLKSFEDPEDLGATMRDLQDTGMVGNRPMCITAQPPLLGHHFPAKASSDISGHGGAYVAVVETKYVRWSVRMNLGRLIKGEKIVDQWPDTDGGGDVEG